MARICVFDVNETLLDMASLDSDFERVFGDAGVRKVWFDQFLMLWLTEMVTGSYQEFGTIGSLALQMVAGSKDVKLSSEEANEILGGLRRMPPHPDVEEGLLRLKDAGFTLVTLTNSTAGIGEAQIENSGLGAYFERTFSADSVKRLKPAPEPYRMVADSLGVETNELRLIAAHGWDVAGALRAGCAAAFVARPGKALFPTAPPPDVVGADLREVADRIIRAET